MPDKRPDECFACRSRYCIYRTYTDDLRFDEVACAMHGAQLERYADETLGDALRWHSISMVAQKRQKTYA